MKRFYLSLFLSALSPIFAAESTTPQSEVTLVSTGTWQHEEIKRFPASEATQGVVADENHLYVIHNNAIGKYRKDSHEKVAEWKDPKGGPFIHLNAGTMHQGKIWCAHSNFPRLPMTSSVEIFNPETLVHDQSISLGLTPGSLTWIAWHEGHWYACFAHYSKDKVATGKDPSWTELVRYDADWRRTQAWVFPPRIIEIFHGSSSSCGSISKDGTLFITGHDAKMLFVLRFPKAGSVLDWVDTIHISAEGQAFSWDPQKPDLFYGIVKRSKEVVISRIWRKE
jgi:hypothetical protein